MINEERHRQTYLTPDEAVSYLQDRHGIRLKRSTLAKKRCIGGGPVFHTALRRTYYTTDSLDEWAPTQISVARTSTSQPLENLAA